MSPVIILISFLAISPMEPFQVNIYAALKTLSPQHDRYRTLKLIFPDNSYQTPEIVRDFVLLRTMTESPQLTHQMIT